MSKQKAKGRQGKEKDHPPKSLTKESALLRPQTPSVPLLITSSVLLAVWLGYLFVVALWGS